MNIEGTAYFKRRRSNTKWIIQCQPHIKHVPFHCWIGGAHHNQIQMWVKNYDRMKRIEVKSLYDIRITLFVPFPSPLFSWKTGISRTRIHNHINLKV